MSGPSLRIRLPPRSLFKFPPDEAPPALPPPSDELHWLASPFQIPESIYQAAFHPAVPITIAVTYAVTVTYLNAYNRQNGMKPWPISKTRPFYIFVIFHNVFLAVYSAITCYAMGRAMYNSWVPTVGQHGLVGAIDSLCKIQGPRGLGDAVYFNPASGAWESKNAFVKLASSGLPDSSDVGRIWNEGLAFWGWWFYLSKFYEVLDTAIILAKGKRSTTLQKYHHAGAMMCMWAGMRYMSPPIWLFVQLNSGIHAMMYTYYTLAALGFRVPQAIKRSLTSMQIMQFLIGVTFAALHLMVDYTVPVSTPYRVARAARAAVSTVSSVASSAVAEATTASAMYSIGNYIKKLALRAAGEEGLAENIGEPAHFGIKDQIVEKVEDLTHFAHHEPEYETMFRDQYQWQQCIDTTGQSFAIWLNIVYLAPLTILFGRFFFKSYIRRVSPQSKQQNKSAPKAAAKAIEDAGKGVDRKVEETGKKAEDTISKPNGVQEAMDTVSKKHKEDMEELEGMKRSITEKFTRILNEETQTIRRREEESEKVEELIEERIESSESMSDSRGGEQADKEDDADQSFGDGSLLGGSYGVEGLSTTDSKEEGAEYAEVVKRPAP